MTEDQAVPLDSYKQLPAAGAVTFQIGDQSVMFAALHDDGGLKGWGVTSDDPAYRGLLYCDSERTRGVDPKLRYVFQYGDPAGVDGPFFVGTLPSEVTITEFKKIYFGVDD